MDIVKNLKNKVETLIKSLKQDMAGIRTNRPSAALVENIMVNYYDQVLPLKQISSISIVPPREINIQVWDKSAAPAVIKAIESSSLGLSANQNDNVIRINLPELSAERREEFVKHAKKRAEEFRIKLRQFRDDANKEVQKSFESGALQEDMKFKLKEEVQKEVDSVNKEIDKILESKIGEIQI